MKHMSKKAAADILDFFSWSQKIEFTYSKIEETIRFERNKQEFLEIKPTDYENVVYVKRKTGNRINDGHYLFTFDYNLERWRYSEPVSLEFRQHKDFINELIRRVAEGEAVGNKYTLAEQIKERGMDR